MRKLLVFLGLMAVLASPAMAYRPAGWIYVNWPWAYDATSGDWIWFNTPDTQWVNGFPPADGWRTLPQSALAAGWSFYQWPYAYCPANNAWYYINETDSQWVVNMRTGEWSRFGVVLSPSLANLAGRWTGINSFGENISAILAPDGSFTFTVPNGTSTGMLSLTGAHLSGTYGRGFGTFSGDVSGNTMIGQFSELDGDNGTFTMVRQPI
jgi:hypothetical protein